MKINFEFQLLLTAAASATSYLLGGFDKSIQILLILAIFDYVTGVFKSIINKNLSSYVGFKGIIKKVCLFVVIVTTVQIENAIGQPETIHNLVAYAFIVNESISILENCAEMGIPIPKVLRDALERIKNNENQRKRRV